MSNAQERSSSEQLSNLPAQPMCEKSMSRLTQDQSIYCFYNWLKGQAIHATAIIKIAAVYGSKISQNESNIYETIIKLMSFSCVYT